MERYQVVVIGGGSAGMTTAAGTSSLGAKTALIEKRDTLGGDCLHFGCVPSKSLIDAANRIHTMKTSANTFGFTLSGQLDFSKVTDHIKTPQSIIQEHDGTKRFTDLGVDMFFGSAKFLSPHEIQIGENEVIYAEKIVIATGSTPIIPPIEGLSNVPCVTNETIFDQTELPKVLGVIGGGTIGLEMAQAFARLGSEVHVFEGSDKLFAKDDQDISTFMYNVLKEEFSIELNSSVQSVEKINNQVNITYQSKNGAEKSIVVDQVLVSTGRKPNVDALQLRNAGVAMVNQFIEVDSSFRTSQSHIFAVGDTINTLPFTHAAGEEAKTVVSNVLFGLQNSLNHDFTPWVTFTSPEVFHVGKTEQQAKETGKPFKIYRAHLDEVDRFITSHESRGFVKIITDNKGYIIGAHAAGKEAGEWMQLVVYAMKNKNKIGSLSRMIYSYPTKAGALQKAADLYWREKLFDGPLPKLTKKFFDLKFKLTGKYHDKNDESANPTSMHESKSNA